MRILISGASGFVGLNLVEAALQRGDDVIALSIDDLPLAAQRLFAALSGRLHAIRGDVLDGALVASLFERFRPDGLIPAAALTPGPSQERAQAERTMMVNVIGVARMLEAAQRYGVRRVVYPSSGAVYGANAFGATPLDEESTPPLPESIYAISKYAAERMALRYRDTVGLDLVAARLGTVFGPWERDTGLRETLSPHWQILRQARAGRQIVLPGPGRRDWIYSRDIAAALLHLLDARNRQPAVVNIGPGIEWTIEAWCKALAARMPGLRWRMADDATPPTVDYWMSRERAPLANRRLVEAYGFRPRFGLEESIEDLMAWQARAGEY